MSTPLSPAEPNNSQPAAAASEENSPAAPAKKPRKGPRRATAPAGAPTPAASAKSATLLLDANGMIVTSLPKAPVASEPDAGSSVPDGDSSLPDGDMDDAETVAVAGADADADDADSDADAEREAEADSESDAGMEGSDAALGQDPDDSTAEAAKLEEAGTPEEAADSDANIPSTDSTGGNDHHELADAPAEPAYAGTPSPADSPAIESTQAAGQDPDPSAAEPTSTEAPVEEAPAVGEPADVEAPSPAEALTSEAPQDKAPQVAAPAGATPVEGVSVEAPDTDVDPVRDPEDPAATVADGETETAATEPAAREDKSTQTESDAVQAPIAAETLVTEAPDESDAKESEDTDDTPDTADTADDQTISDEATTAPSPAMVGKAQATGGAISDEGVPETAAPSSQQEAEPEVEAAPKPAPAEAGAVEAVPDAEAEPTEQPPLTRRERRMAEQRLAEDTLASEADEGSQSPAVSVAATAHELVPADAEKPATSTAAPAQPVRSKNRFLTFLKGLFVLLIISVVVVGMGTVLSGQKDQTSGPSQTEQHRQAAWERTGVLMSQVSALTTGGNSPAVSSVLVKIGSDLKRQYEALGSGLPPASDTSAAPVPVTSVSDFAQALADSGNELLSNALGADRAMGRVFASAGTSQLIQARLLAQAAGTTPPGSKFLTDTVSIPTLDAPHCTSSLEPRPGVTVDAALETTAASEQKAVYAYEVALPRLVDSQQHADAAKVLARHQTKLTALNAELTARCLPEAAPVAGYSLDPSFLSAPLPALATLEGQLAQLYADLAALSSPVTAKTTDTAAPATSAAESNGTADTAPANPTMLREISVAWLADSSNTQVMWGGATAALSGMPAAETTP